MNRRSILLGSMASLVPKQEPVFSYTWASPDREYLTRLAAIDLRVGTVVIPTDGDAELAC